MMDLKGRGELFVHAAGPSWRKWIAYQLRRLAEWVDPPSIKIANITDLKVELDP